MLARVRACRASSWKSLTIMRVVTPAAKMRVQNRIGYIKSPNLSGR
jgi:hypothetical protein